MASSQSSTDGGRRVSRNISHPLKRRSTKGPLDSADDPLAGPSQPVSDTAPTSAPATTIAKDDATTSSSLPATIAALPDEPSPVNVNLSFLQDRRLYHKVPTDDIPQAFLKSSQQPALQTSLSVLLQEGHFRRAAEAALNDLLRCSASEPERILQLLYCRLACLVLVGRHDLAADEAVPLHDFFSSNGPDVSEIAARTPWELRVMLVRLQLFSAQDGGRRGIMSIYGLASEVRANIRRSKDETDKQRWSQRLQDLGYRVADALVEIGELETAYRHLDSLSAASLSEVAIRKTILDIHTGNLLAARQNLANVEDRHMQTLLETLLKNAQDDPRQSLDGWHDVSQADKNNLLAIQNEAVFLLYIGRITDARSILQSTMSHAPVNSTLLFNLSTIHELCSEKAMAKKLRMADELANKTPDSATGGWERLNGELKL